jgi:hypothetical protein
MGKPFSLLFSTQRDGYSLSTLYSRARGVGASLLLVLDDQHNVFGGFASRDWSGDDFSSSAHVGGGVFTRGSVGYLPSPVRGRTSDSWFGSGDAFLFRLRPAFEVYRWTRHNSLFQLAKDDCIAFGGSSASGSQRCGLWLDSALEKGSSSASETYGNPPLAPPLPGSSAAAAGLADAFRVVRVELYGFGDFRTAASTLPGPKAVARSVLQAGRAAAALLQSSGSSTPGAGAKVAH